MLLPSFAALGIYIAILVASILGIIFSGLFSQNVRTMVEQARSTVISANNSLNSISNIPNKALDNIGIITSAVDPLIQTAESLYTPITNITSTLSGTVDTLILVNSTTAPVIYGHIDSVRAGLRTLANNTGLTNVPNADTVIPDVQTNVINGINIGVSNLNSGVAQIVAANQTVANTISDVKRQVNDTVRSTIQTNVVSQVSSITNSVNGIMSQVSSVLPSTVVDDIFYYVYVVENVRISLVTVFFVWCGALYILAIVGILLKVPLFIEVTACCTCTTAWLFFLIAAVQIPLFMFANDACTTGPNTVLFIANDTGSSFFNGQSIAGLNLTLDITTAVKGIAACSGNQSFLTAALGNDYLTQLGITGLVTSATSQVTSQLGSFNISSMTSSARSFLNQANVTSIKTDYTSDVDTAYNTLDTAINELYNISNFNGFNLNNFTDTLTVMNNFTSQFGQYYTCDNYTLLDPNSNPYNQTTNTRDTAQGLKGAVGYQCQLYNTTMTKILSLNSTIYSVRAGLANLRTDFSTLTSQLAPVKNLPAIVLEQLDYLTNQVSSFINGISSSITDIIISKLTTYINAVVGDTLGCAFVGSLVSTANNTICNGMVNETILTAIFSLIIAVLMIVMFFVLVIVAKRVRYQSTKGTVTETDIPEVDLHH